MGQYPPDLKLVEREIDDHLQKNNKLAQVFEVFKKVLLAQLNHLDQIQMGVTLSEEELKDCFRNNQYVMSCQDITLDEQLFLALLDDICQAIKEASPDAPDALLKFSQDPELQEGKISKFLEQIKLLNKKELETLIQEKEMHQRTGLDSEVISYVLFSSLSPFYSILTQRVLEKTDFALWRNHYCPVCGQKPVMGKHRVEDGARILACWLCHAQWNYPRLECPHCQNNEQKQLRFFYVQEDKARQVHVCENCKHYLKFVDAKMLQKDVCLDVEAIATGHLDVLAEKEGYTLPEIASMLN